MVGKVFSYCISLLLLMTHVGMPVFTHECHSMGKAWSSFYIPAKSCCSGQKGDASSQICHHNAEPHTAFNKMPCCENHHGLIQLNSDFVHYKPMFNDLELQCVAIYPNLEFVALSSFPSTLHTTRSHGPPLKLYGRSLLISEQLFLC